MGFFSKLLGVDKTMTSEAENLASLCQRLQKVMPDRDVITSTLRATGTPFHADEDAIVWQTPFSNAYATRFVLSADSEYILVYFLSSMRYNSLEDIQIHVSDSGINYFYPKKRNDLANIVLKTLETKGFSGYESMSPF